jgi:hypothetical protein
MLALLYWAIGVILESIWWVSQKKALSASNNLSKTLFKLFAHVIWILLFVSLMLFFPFNYEILWDKSILFYIFLISFFTIVSQNFEILIIKKEKLSTLMPYENIDKIFVVIFGFFLFQWNSDNAVSLITMLIVCFTFLIVLLFSVNFKTLKFPVSVLYYIVTKIIKWILILASGYILMTYVSTTFWLIQLIFTIVISIIISYLLRDSFKSLILQSKEFYKYRFFAVITWQIAFVLWLFIIESAWVIIASLLWFLAVISKTLSITFLLQENPTNKQIILSLLVVLLIWFWLYFK